MLHGTTAERLGQKPTVEYRKHTKEGQEKRSKRGGPRLGRVPPTPAGQPLDVLHNGCEQCLCAPLAVPDLGLDRDHGSSLFRQRCVQFGFGPAATVGPSAVPAVDGPYYGPGPQQPLRAASAFVRNWRGIAATWESVRVSQRPWEPWEVPRAGALWPGTSLRSNQRRQRSAVDRACPEGTSGTDPASPTPQVALLSRSLGWPS